LLEQAHGTGDRGLGGAVGLGQLRHALRTQLVEERQDANTRGVPEAASYGAHEAGGVHDELRALLLKGGRHPGRIQRPSVRGVRHDHGMPTYIAFLRAINIGKRQFAKAAIIKACEDAGCTDVETYINTGNVRVTTPLRSRAKVEATLEAAFAAEAGFDVAT